MSHDEKLADLFVPRLPIFPLTSLGTIQGGENVYRAYLCLSTYYDLGGELLSEVIYLGLPSYGSRSRSCCEGLVLTWRFQPRE
jgi:hypothetical protein